MEDMKYRGYGGKRGSLWVSVDPRAPKRLNRLPFTKGQVQRNGPRV